MAGLPRRVLKRLDLLTRQAATLVRELSRQMPRLYRERSVTGDPVADAWTQAIDRSSHAWLAVHDLGAAIATRHKMPRRVITDATPIELDGDFATLNDWCERYGRPVAVVLHRVEQKGWDWESAIVYPLNKEEIAAALTVVSTSPPADDAGGHETDDGPNDPEDATTAKIAPEESGT